MRSLALPGKPQVIRIVDACKQQGSISPRSTASPFRSASKAVSTETVADVRNQQRYSTSRRWLSDDSNNPGAARPVPTPEVFTADSVATPSAQQQRGTPPISTHYDLFPKTLPLGPPPAGPFHIDARALHREFLELQSRAHPDLAPAHLKTRAEATSSRINDAYRTLLVPLTRAQYALALRGRDVANDESDRVEDSDLLTEVMEAREEIEEARTDDDLVTLRSKYAARESESVARLESLLGKDGDLDAAVRECVRLRYWTNIRESLHNWEKGKPVVLQH